MAEIRLRKFPYPYQAALSICSDIDGTSSENFLTIHKFLNSTQPTELGDGLGLQISDSFWMYDKPGISESAFSYFADLSGRESEQAPVIRELIKAGILDVMHGYGNFASPADFSRNLAKKALDELDRYNLNLKVWTNHGGIESVQNIGNASFGMGDIILSSRSKNAQAAPDFYHADLLMKYGIHYYWDSEASLSQIVGQDRTFGFSEAYWTSPLNQNLKMKSKSIVKAMLSFLDKLYFKYNETHFVPWTPLNKTNKLIEQDQLRDGHLIYKFTRFGNGRFDWADDLDYLLNDRVLQRLLEKMGYLILYIHLGDRKQQQSAKPLSDSAVKKFKQLAELFFAGKLWIATTSQLLTYNRVFHHLDWDIQEKETSYHIQINGLKDQLYADQLNEADLSGLSFIVPNDRNVKIFLNQRPVDFQIFKNQGSYIAQIPLKHIEWPLS